MEESFADAYAGASNSGKTLMVDQGSKFVATTIPPDDAQYLQTRQFQGGEISTKIFGIPPHLTGDTEKQTSWGSGVEQMGIVFLTYTLMPEAVMQEAEVNMKLLNGGLYCKTNMAAVVRADFKSRQEGLAIMRRNGIINADTWCDFEELDLLPDGLGQKYIVEGNMTTLDKVGEEPAAVAPAAA
jgi:HK97 family phage portal protein